MPKELVAIINPKRRARRKTTSRKRARRNPELMIAANPRRRRKRSPVALSSPKWTYRRRRSRRNPVGGFKIGLNSIAFTTLGAVGSKVIPGFIPFLKDKNKGLIGYGIQAGTGFALSMAIDKLLKQKKAAPYILLGTGVSIAVGLIDDFWFKRNVSVKGLGFYPDEQLNNIDLGDYEIVPDDSMDEYVLQGMGQEFEIEGIGQDIPLDEMAGLDLAPRKYQPALAKRRTPVRPQVATQRPIIVGAAGCCQDRLKGRW